MTYAISANALQPRARMPCSSPDCRRAKRISPWQHSTVVRRSTFGAFLNSGLALGEPADPPFENVHASLLNPFGQFLERTTACVFCHDQTPLQLM
jgi:hypothetical protein